MLPSKLTKQQKFQKMLDLKTKPGSAEDKEGDILNAYQSVWFQFIATIFHEIGHIFMTYLGEGVYDTPPTTANGEIGFRLEELVFGGVLKFRRDKRVGDSDYGVCPSTIASVQGQYSRVLTSHTGRVRLHEKASRQRTESMVFSHKGSD